MMAIKIRTPWGLQDQSFHDGKKKWFVSRLIDKSKDLEVKEMAMDSLNISRLIPHMETMHDFVAHMRKVLDSDTEYPIILDDEGFVMDGRHRIAKAMLQGCDTIKYVRFEETPAPDVVSD